MKANEIPKSLKGWFVVHFIMDTIMEIGKCIINRSFTHKQVLNITDKVITIGQVSLKNKLQPPGGKYRYHKGQYNTFSVP